ncbi:hypothetical protein [Azovibrio restrictus]|uniref:hypothetical protein n=1 Tax=Azovibrio restrictus TaxID=146938 RepID=UPI0026EB23CE|nr:hypothetical protein [Azovibrio restrictus]
MPASSIASAIVSSIVTAIIESPSTPVPPVPAVIERNIPDGAVLGKLAGPPDMMGNVTIDDKVFMASPGLQIRDEMNLLMFPTLVGHDVPVRYQLDPMGGVWRIWLMTPAEVAALKSR